MRQPAGRKEAERQTRGRHEKQARNGGTGSGCHAISLPRATGSVGDRRRITINVTRQRAGIANRMIADFRYPAGILERMANEDSKTFTVHDRVLVPAMAVVLGLILILQLIRGFDRAEVVATLMLFLVLLAIVVGGVVGGLAVGVVGTVVYAVLRLPAVDVLGSAAFARSVGVHGAVLIGFGGLGGYSHGIIRSALVRSDGNEMYEPGTSCLSPRTIVYLIDGELARAQRYQRPFSIISIDLGEEVFASLNHTQQSSIRLELGELLQSTVRATDHVSIISMNDRDRILMLLPETARSGADLFLPRVVDKVSAMLLNRNAAMPRKVGDLYSADADAPQIQRLRNEAARFGNVPLLIDLGKPR